MKSLSKKFGFKVGRAQLVVGKLTCWKLDLDGDVQLDFQGFSNVGKLDLLKDWIGLLQREYDDLYQKECGNEP